MRSHHLWCAFLAGLVFGPSVAGALASIVLIPQLAPATGGNYESLVFLLIVIPIALAVLSLAALIDGMRASWRCLVNDPRPSYLRSCRWLASWLPTMSELLAPEDG